MVWSTRSSTRFNLQVVLERIGHLGQLTRQDHLLLTSAILTDQHLSETERRDINRIFDAVQTGRLKVID